MNKILEKIDKIVESNGDSEQKVKELLELKYNSREKKNIIEAIKKIYKDDFNAILTDKDIDSEINNIAYINEGIITIQDEKMLKGMTSKKKELIASLEKKLEEYKETKIAEEEPVEESKEDLDFSLNPEEDEAKALEEFEQEDQEEHTIDIKDIYNADYKDLYVVDSHEEEKESSNIIDKKIAELSEKSEELSKEYENSLSEIKKQIVKLNSIKKEEQKLDNIRARQLELLNAEMEKRKKEIEAEYSKRKKDLYAKLDSDN